MTKQQFKEYINGFDFINLFNHLGWAYIKEITPIKIEAETYTLQSIAEKSGFRILICQPDKNVAIPEYPIRLKIHNNISRLFKEHLIIFINKENTQQVWQTVQKEIGKPAKLSTVNWNKGQEPELLFQKAGGLIFTLAEEDDITIVDVTKRVADNFSQNNERVTKQFYDRFKQQHTEFLKFIKGIEDKVNQDWYASLMLNRLMFCYFIQKKGFLDNNKNYLTDKLKECQNKKGKNKFYSFYRNFLLSLFHEGLGAPEHSKELEKEIGTIPYLNGGLFDTHEIEKDYKDKIEIDDKAFESIFKFFDEWEWHLDTRHTASGRDINPDVIGYIFEKYINDRADMGAYYTKEDITDYISKNCIIPFLFDETKRQLPKAFNADGDLWQSVKQSGDKYIYDAVKHGINFPSPLGEGLGVRFLPKEIAVGIKNVAARTEWNKPAPPEFALPTEIWREVIDRRNRYNEITTKIEKGEIQNINDFITHNLNIRQFAIDSIVNTNDPEFLKSFYKSLNSVTIIDPTCGSGAFLFAAMNILEELYEQCIQRIRAFVEDEDRTNAGEKKVFSHKFKYFREVLENLQSPQHPNLQYFIYKNIILRNLYGVDIMMEAVEIAKLRLFLKLVATVDADYSKPNFGLEPLPDIDFNIRAGNTLVGFATNLELKTGSLDFQEDEKKVLEEMEKVNMAFERFKEIQLIGDITDYKDFKDAKNDYQNRLTKLKGKLDKSFYNAFGDHKKLFVKWIQQTKPFHWFAEFYEIVNGNGGFDVIIGNPPYVEYAKVKNEYEIKKYTTEKAGNLYAFVIERCLAISNSETYFGMIIPMSSICTDRSFEVQKIFKSRKTYLSNYSGDRNPAEMFDGVKMRLTIFISKNSNSPEMYITKYTKWYTSYRPFLIDTIKYQKTIVSNIATFPKIDCDIASNIYKKIKKDKPAASFIREKNKGYYFHNAPIHWVKAFDFVPYFKSAKNGVMISSHYKSIYAENEQQTKALVAILNSSLFFFWFIIHSNSRDLSLREIGNFCFDFTAEKDLSILGDQFSKLMNCYKKISERIIVQYKTTGTVEYEQIDTKLAKKIIDEIDKTLAKHYLFSAEELDFIINYDIKYRMGKEASDTEEKIIPSLLTAINMKEFSLNEGIYFVSDVVRYTNLPPQKIRRWFRELSKENYEGLSGKEQSNVDKLRISFHGLVELVVIGTLRENGFSLKKIMNAREDLKIKTKKIYPFATNNVKENLKPIKDENKPKNSILTFTFPSGNVTLDGSGQYNLDFITEFFNHIEFDTEGLAQRIFPVKNSRLIIIDPKQGGGKAMINGKGVEAQVISMIYTGKESVTNIKTQYDVTEEEILVAVNYWN